MKLKIVLTFILTLTLALCLCACGETDSSGTTDAPAATTTAPQATTTVPADDGTVTYTVKVVDENGAPVAGAMVQLCKDTCVPAITDENGAAAFKLAEDDYKVSIMSVPAGYTYDMTANEFHFDSGSCELTLTVNAAE